MTFFHKTASALRKRNFIHRLRKDDNSFASTQSKIEDNITEFFSQLFSSQNPREDDIRKITNLVQCGVTQEMNNYFDTPFTVEEVRKALFDLHPSKAPGPDGFIALFFQNAGILLATRSRRLRLKCLIMGPPLRTETIQLLLLSPRLRTPLLFHNKIN